MDWDDSDSGVRKQLKTVAKARRGPGCWRQKQSETHCKVCLARVESTPRQWVGAWRRPHKPNEGPRRSDMINRRREGEDDCKQ